MTMERARKNMQFSVAMMSPERNWSVEDIRAMVKRIRQGKGLRASEDENATLGVPSPSYPTMAQRYLHENIDRLLSANEEKVVRFLKKKGEANYRVIMDVIGISHTPSYENC